LAKRLQKQALFLQVIRALPVNQAGMRSPLPLQPFIYLLQALLQQHQLMPAENQRKL